jgi:hypothetical protein
MRPGQILTIVATYTGLPEAHELGFAGIKACQAMRPASIQPLFFLDR